MEDLESKNYYQRLEVTLDASTEDIRQAYRVVARLHHPDLNSASPAIKDKDLEFRMITEAYNTLIDPDKRRDYDSKLPAGLQSWSSSKNEIVANDGKSPGDSGIPKKKAAKPSEKPCSVRVSIVTERDENTFQALTKVVSVAEMIEHQRVNEPMGWQRSRMVTPILQETRRTKIPVPRPIVIGFAVLAVLALVALMFF